MTSAPQILAARTVTSTQECYRQLARAIIGPVHPQDDPAIFLLRGRHIRLLAPSRAVMAIHALRAA